MGLVCRLTEEAGIATVCVATGRDLIAKVNPPRSVFVNFPMGNNFGPRDEPDTQLAIIRDAFALLDSVEEGGHLEDLPYQWHEEFASRWLEQLHEKSRIA